MKEDVKLESQMFSLVKLSMPIIAETHLRQLRQLRDFHSWQPQPSWLLLLLMSLSHSLPRDRLHDVRRVMPVLLRLA